jgi:hypothetical protein
VSGANSVLGKAHTAFRQLTLLPFLRWLFFEGTRKLLNPFAATSYSQFAEDLLIKRLLGPRTGFYVDVGCHHPVISQTLICCTCKDGTALLLMRMLHSALFSLNCVGDHKRDMGVGSGLV